MSYNNSEQEVEEIWKAVAKRKGARREKSRVKTLSDTSE